MNRLSYTPDEIARLGDAVYDRDIAPWTTARDSGQFVAIDVETGAFSIAPDELSATRPLRMQNPDAPLWLRRVDAPYLHRFSPRSRSQAERPL